MTLDANGTVSFGNTNAAGDHAIVGDFTAFKWGYSKDIPLEVIEYGNPDNSDLGDLKGHNQVYIRGEAYIGWGIIVPEAFERIIYVPENPSGSEEGGSGEGGEG
jgi:hypothetical protein